MKLPEITYRGAELSPDGLYRYSLERRWLHVNDQAPYVLWVMLNPSIADALIDDPTIKRCIGFSYSWGFNRMIVTNLYAWRTTNPLFLPHAFEDRRGPKYYEDTIGRWGEKASVVVCAWGANRFVGDPLPLCLDYFDPQCLGRTKSGEPKHPLYLAADTPLVDYI